MAKTTKKPCRRCWVPTCRNAKPKEAAKKKLFLFPRDVIRCREWVKAIGDVSLAETELKKLNTIRFVCEDHFPPTKITPQTRPAADAVPVLFNPERIPLTDDDLQEFDLQVNTNDEDVSEPRVTNQDSCTSGSSSELSRSSFELCTPSLDDYYSLESNEEHNFEPLHSDPPADSDFPWFELSLPSLDTCGVDLNDPAGDNTLSWSFNDSVLCDSERFSAEGSSTSLASSPTHEDFSIVHNSNSASFQNCIFDSAGIIIH